jgi:uncharacterized protein YkwD
MYRRTFLYAILISFLILIVFSVGALGRQENDYMPLTDARQYMLDLINRDRKANGLNPVVLDQTATEAGQQHAEEMARMCYLSHWDQMGRLPDQRYTEQGGAGFVQENVFLGMHYRRSQPDGPVALESSPLFSRTELEEIEQTYMNELPPNDGHRQNILNPYHTQVGISLAKSSDSDATIIANTQEFVSCWIRANSLPASVRVGDSIKVSGKIIGLARFSAITVGRYPLPMVLRVGDLRQTSSYSAPPAYVTYCPAGYVTPAPVQTDSNGCFSIVLPLNDNGKQGIYYVTIWLQDASGKNFIASQRTILVY